MSAPERSESSTLCMRCGLCCMGVIHQVAALDRDEIGHARKLGLPVLDTERPLFSLPCPHLTGTTCGVYQDRPNACRRYRCQLLQSVESGATGMAEADSRVTEARRLLEELRAVVPAGLGYQELRRMALAWPAAKIASQTGLSEAEANRIKLKAITLDLFVDKVFRNSKDRKSFKLQSVERQVEEDG